MMISLEDFETYAREHLPRPVYNFVSCGANEQHTLNDNCHAFRRYRIRPRVLKDVSKRDLSTTILGRKVPFPIGIAPTALQKLACSDGESAMARGAASLDTIMIVSTYATTSIEEVARASGGGHLWFQLYFLRDRQHTERLIRRAECSGYEALVVTADTPYAGRKLPDERGGGFNPQIQLGNIHREHFPPHQSSASRGDCYDSSEISPAVTWADIQWLQKFTQLPVIIKGIISGESAREAVAYRVDGILVSNHGGRQLDGVPATIDVLPEIVAAADGTGVEVYMDGGIRRGTDVLKALALGARAVFIGRPAWWGLVYKGEEGMQQVLTILRDDLSLAMALSGCSSISDLNPSMIELGADVNAKI